MGNQKQKWTAEEEDALHRGVQKHGVGKWKNILKDPEFAPSLANRSNIDLKDKWRNLNVGNGQGSKEKSRTPKIKTTPPAPASVSPLQIAATPASSAPASQAQTQTQTETHHSSDNADDVQSPIRYNTMVFEALSTIKDANGSDINAIISYIEQKHKVPPNFRKALGSRLRRLVSQGKLEKVENCYKIKKDTPSEIKSPAQQSPASNFSTSDETIKHAADNAAYRVAEAENKSFLAAEAVKEVERISKLAADNDSMLQLVKEIYEKCTADKQPDLLINKFSNHNLVSKMK